MSTTGDPPLETGTTPALAETESFVSDKFREMRKVMESVCEKCYNQSGPERCRGTCGMYCKHCVNTESDLINYFNLMRFIDSIASDPKGSDAPNVTSESKEIDELPPILREIFYEAARNKKHLDWDSVKTQLTAAGFHEGVIDYKEPEIMDFLVKMDNTYLWGDHPEGDWRPEESKKVLFLAGSQAPWNRLTGKKGGSYKRKSKKNRKSKKRKYTKKRKSKKKKTRRRR